MSQEQCRKASTRVYRGRWLSMYKSTYLDRGVEREWEYVSRETKLEGVPDVDGYCIEFPSGLVDEGETAEEAATRELKEETGYLTTKILHTSCKTAYEPGLADSTNKIFIVEIDEFKRGEQELDECEAIEVALVPLVELNDYLLNMEKNGDFIDTKVYSFSLGILPQL